MTPYLFWEFMILVVGVWTMVVAFVVYGWLLLKRQKQMFMQMTAEQSGKTLAESDAASQPVRLEIPKSEPISKYENFVPGEGVDVSFVDKSK